MASGIMLLFVAIFGVTGLGITVLGGSGLRNWWTMRQMEPNRTVVEPGLQEFEGHARATDEPVTAPFSGSQSLICEYEVERRDHGDDQGSNWDTIDSGTMTAPFEVDHSGSTVAVDPDDANTLLTEEFHVDARGMDDVPSRVQEYADGNLSTGSTIELGPIEVGGRRYRFTEERLDDGEEVYVLGPVEQNPRSAPGNSDARLAIAPGERSWRERFVGDPFVVSDTGEKRATRRQLKSAGVVFVLGLLFVAGAIAVVVLA
jgi:hypothetical protein